ncbi:unnamed protein product [Owenia fusiformis]|uniref:Uncharacterized protein n=1 Tax=Owenia fusiformis TaxID=6347 RepID=A0A8J1TFC2_OWEFU|nr:unnamed protein product [Owenia fusiformis]
MVCNTTDSPNHTDHLTILEEEIFKSILTIFSFVVLLGNLTMLFGFVLNKKLRTPKHYLHVNMAASNITLALIMLGSLYIRINGDILCLFTHSLILVGVYYHVLSLLSITVERFIAIKHPFIYAAKVTTRNVIVCIVSSNLLCVTLGVYPLVKMLITDGDYDGDTEGCHLGEISPVVYAMLQVSCMLLILIVMTVLNVRILQSVNSSFRFAQSTVPVSTRRKSLLVHTLNKRKIRATMMLSTVIIYHIITWTPPMITLLLSYIGFNISQLVLISTLTGAYTSTTLNSVMYGFVYREYRTTCVRALCSKIRKNNRKTICHINSSTTTTYL